MGIEIERKFTVKELPADLDRYPCHRIEQAYLNVRPAIRVRRQDDIYYMTYKAEKNSSAASDIGQTEYNMPLDAASYEHMAAKADGNVIRKNRYLIPLNSDGFNETYLKDNPELAKAIKTGDIKIELDVFDAPFDGRILAEVEFLSEDDARNYTPASWFNEDVTGNPLYSNAHMSTEKI